MIKTIEEDFELSIVYYPDGYVTKMATTYSVKWSEVEADEARSKGIWYEKHSSHLGAFRQVPVSTFEGTRQELKDKIDELAKTSYTDYLTLGYYSIILADFPIEYDYVVITWDPIEVL